MKSPPDGYRSWAIGRDIAPDRIESIFIRWRSYAIKNVLKSCDWYADWQDQIEKVIGWDLRDAAKAAAGRPAATGAFREGYGDQWG
jgi:hypothetical protein